MKRFNLSAFVCLCGMTCLHGCAVVTKNQGEVGLRYGHEITFFSRAAQTAPEPATIESKFPSLTDWIGHLWQEPQVPPASGGGVAVNAAVGVANPTSPVGVPVASHVP